MWSGSLREATARCASFHRVPSQTPQKPASLLAGSTNRRCAPIHELVAAFISMLQSVDALHPALPVDMLKQFCLTDGFRPQGRSGQAGAATKDKATVVLHRKRATADSGPAQARASKRAASCECLSSVWSPHTT